MPSFTTMLRTTYIGLSVLFWGSAWVVVLLSLLALLWAFLTGLGALLKEGFLLLVFG